MTVPDAAVFPTVDQTIDLLQSLLSPEDYVRLFHLLGNDGHWQRRFEPVEEHRSSTEAVVVSCYPSGAVKVDVIKAGEAA